MTTTYGSDAQVQDQAKKLAKKRNRKLGVIGTGLAVVVGTTGAAWAAVQLFGFGDADVNASEVQNLTIDNFQTLTPLYPGATVGGKAIVHNPNNIPIKVTAVVIRKEGLDGKGAGCDKSSLHAKGVYNANHGDGIGEGWKTVLAEPVPVAANGAQWVTLPQAVSQDASATKMCGFTAKIAVLAETGS